MSTSRRLSACAGLTLAAGWLVSCGGDELSGPPDLRLGRDECVECGMLINENRCSSAFLIERDGRREHVMFDDIGCMLDYQHAERTGVVVLAGFVHDHNTRAWVEHATAAYLVTDPDRLPTPMGSGMVAFADQHSAEKARAEYSGSITDYPGLTPARQAWLEARRAKAQQPLNPPD